jgi:Ig domain of plant-specific actin-binding protein
VRRIALVLVGIALAAAPAAAHAAAWGVSNTSDTPVGVACPGFTGCSLRQAVTSTEANPGADAILVNAGTYPLTNGELTVTQDLTVARVGAGAVIVNGSGASRIFDVSGSGTDFTLRFMTLTNGSASGLSPSLGGAIKGGSGTTIGIESSTLSFNLASDDQDAEGGAIYSNGDVAIGTASGSTTGSSINGNAAATTQPSGTPRGGGVAVSGGTLTVGARTTMSNNQASDESTDNATVAAGGGVYAGSGATFTGATVSGNTATGGEAAGGGVAVVDGATFVRSTVSGNTATDTADGGTAGGGGVATVSLSGTIDLQFSTVSGNAATATSTGPSNTFGGAIVSFTSIDASNSTIADNSVSTPSGSASGAGVSSLGQPITLGGTILANNTGSSGTQCDGASLTSDGYSVLGDLGSCSYTAGTGDVTGVSDALLKPLADYGGLTQTMMLRAGSPALDIIPAAASLCTDATTDQRGVSRPQNGTCDAGSVEARPATLAIAPSSKDFGYLLPSTLATSNATVSNNGELDTPAPTIGVNAPFSASGCAGTLSAGSDCTLALTFAPTAGGSFTRTLHLSSGSLSADASLHGIGWAPLAPPKIKRAPSVGYETGVDGGKWPAAVASYAAQWQRCEPDGTGCVDITGATHTVYRPVLADAGHTLRVSLRATSTTGLVSDPAFTPASEVVTRTVPTAYQAPAIKRADAPVVGVRLAVYAGHWTGAPDSYGFQWIRCDADGASNCDPISGATGSGYTPKTADIGHTLRVDVTATNPAGTGGPVRTAPSGVVTPST